MARIRRIPLRSALSPQAALLAIRDEPWPFALLGRWGGGGAILGCRPLTVAGPGADPPALLDRLPVLRGGQGKQGPRDGAAIGGGWFGWLGYGLGGRIERLPPQPPRPTPLPEAHLAYYDHLLRRDPAGRWWFEALVAPGREAELERRLADLRRRLSCPPPAPDRTVPGTFRPVPPGSRGHIAAVRRCRERIHAGEFFQANLRLRLRASWRGDLASLFARTAGALAPAYGAAFITPWGGVASMSPELFLRRCGASVETAPIKGTIARPAERGRAASVLRSLRHSGKDVAEHVMIVDVARNDLGRVCEFGTVEAPCAPSAEAHPGVWHLVSGVRGRLRPGVGDGELVRAAFPPASVTGAPKIQAMRAIAELETIGREVYTGALGYASPAAGLELNVAIRTFEAADGCLWLDVGGGIVAESVPQRELEEGLAKAHPLVSATGSVIAAEPPERRYRPAPGPGRRPSRGDPGSGPPPALAAGRARPDPALGLLETILVQEGRPRRVDEHLTRLVASLRALYGVSPRPGLTEQLDAIAALGEAGALRVRARPDGRIQVEAGPLRQRAAPVRLTAVTLPGGLGAHKWADRRLLDALTRGGATPLLVDADGSVLEAAWANVWIVEGDRLLTPPADGRILPGVTRDSLLRGRDDGRAAGLARMRFDDLRLFRAAEEGITLERLMGADAVLLSASIAGIVPACLIGNETKGRPPEAIDPAAAIGGA